MPGNDALAGIAKKKSAVNGEHLTAGAGPIDVVGYAPSSFVQNGFLTDSRRLT